MGNIQQQTKIGAIVLREQNATVDLEIAHDILFQHARKNISKALHLDAKTKQLLQRLDFMRTKVEIPTLEELLADLCYGKKSFAELRNLSLSQEILRLLSWEHKKHLEKLVPTHFTCPSGASVPIDYSDPESPCIAARIQQLFGLESQPIIADKTATISLLAPNNRPQQRTQNITAFWKKSYLEIRKELRGRYPKHAWPEQPTRSDAQNRPQRKNQRN